MKSFLFIVFQYLVPQHFISRLIGKLASSENHWIKSFFIGKFADTYQVNMAEAKIEDTSEYKSFNDFFCRELKPEARPIDTDTNNIVSPADGAFSQLGQITDGKLFQAKGHSFSAAELIGGNQELAKEFQNGQFATIYLSPKDYHRVHMPVDGKLISMNHIPGDLFSVNGTTAENVPNLFSRNERVSCLFETPHGPMVMVLVGAMVVASIDTVWAGEVAPIGKKVTHFNYADNEEVFLKKGEEMGRFKLGSTVILLFPPNTIEWNKELKADSPIQMGVAIAQKEEMTKESLDNRETT